MAVLAIDCVFSRVKLRTALSILDVAGYDVVLIETVGTGQADVDLRYVADTVVLVLLPDSGDTVQFLKAGSLEAADIYIVNKSDRGKTGGLAAELKGTLNLTNESSGNEIVVIQTSAITKNDVGIRELAEHLQQIHDDRTSNGNLRAHRETKLKGQIMAGIRNAMVSKLLTSQEAHALTLDLVKAIQAGSIDIETGINRAVEKLWGNPQS